MFLQGWLPGVDLASMDNGSGDRYWLALASYGALLVGFNHESTKNPWNFEPPGSGLGTLQGIPDRFLSMLDHPDLHLDGILLATIVVWSDTALQRWQAPVDGRLDDGLDELFGVLKRDGYARFAKFAREYYEVNVSASVVRDFYENRELSREMVKATRVDVDFDSLRVDLAAIGYPVKT